MTVRCGDCFNAYNGGSGPGSGIDSPGKARNAQRPRLPTGFGLSAPHLKPKDLVGMPWRLALALQDAGWWNRGDIIWAKPNPMPESVTDRPTRAHEYLFLMTRSARYFYDAEAVREPQVTDFNGDGRHPIPPAGGPRVREVNGSMPVPSGWATGPGDHSAIGHSANRVHARGISASGYDERKWQDRSDGRSRPPMTMLDRDYNPSGRNLRSVWTITTQAFPGAHFATFPESLVEPCIRAGTSERGACGTCGAPWRRIVRRAASRRGETAGKWSGEDPQSASRSMSEHTAGARANGREHDNPFMAPQSVGWRPICRCGGYAVRSWYSRRLERSWYRVRWQARIDAAWPEPAPCLVLDPFAGSGTVGVVALQRGCSFIGLELNPAYVAIARRRISGDCPLFNTAAEVSA